jgi:anaerobic selenocysteine-containing dehydrogenase
MQRDSEQPTDRRRFLKTTAAAGAGAAATALLPEQAAAEPASADTSKKPAEGYRRTRHVADYYASARL